MNRVPKLTQALIIIVFIVSLFILYQPLNIVKAADKDEENIKTVLSEFYQAIVDQNFGLAEKFYTIPAIGPTSNIDSYKDLNSPIEYFNFLYSQSDYILKKYEILNLEQMEPNNFHAKIKLSGNQSKDNQSIAFTQDVLISLNESNEWIISLEDYPKYMQSLVESKDIKELSGKEIIYKFFIEMDKGNYGLAAKFINPSMSNIDGNTDEIIPYLKNWHINHLDGKNHITSSSLYILNEFEVTKEDSIFLISSQPTRNDTYLRKTFSCNLCSTPIHSFFEVTHEKNGYLLNIKDADKKIYDLLNNSTSKKKSDIENSVETIDDSIEWLKSSITGPITTVITVIIAILIIPAILIFIRNVFFGVSQRPSRYYPNSTYLRRTDRRAEENTDIAASVDSLLNNNSSTEGASDKKQVKNLPLTKNEPQRKIHMSKTNESSNYDSTTSSDVYSRKIYTDDE